MNRPAGSTIIPQATAVAGRRVEQVTRLESARSIFHVPGTALSAEQRDVGLGAGEHQMYSQCAGSPRGGLA